MPVSANLKELLEQLPVPDQRGMFCTDIDKEKIEKAIAEIYKGGKDNVLAIVDLLVEPGKGNDVKPHYALRCLGNYALQRKDEAGRRAFAEALASQLGGNRPRAVQAFLCQELQFVGRQEAVAALGKLLADEVLVDPAAMALVAIKDGAATVLRAALPTALGRCRLVILHSLAALAEPQSAESFKQALTDPDREVRLAAGAGLARIGNAGAVDPLLKASLVEPGWERIQQTKHCLVLAEKLASTGQKSEAARVYQALSSTRTDASEKYIHDAAQRGLASLK
jgi:hypothetical protein